MVTRDAIRPVDSRLRAPQSHENVIPRARLFARLDRGLGARLILVSAPAGFGKTTMLATWLADRGISAAWVSLDALDNDRVRFARYLREAFHSLYESHTVSGGDSLPSDIDLRVLITRLLELVRTSEEHRLLVLDDYHLIESPAIHEAVAFLLGQVPPSLHVVLATRADPPFPLARLRASDELVELRAEDLRFGSDEARAFVTKTHRLEIHDADLEILLQRTEGWIAGLKLATLSLEGRSDVSSFVREFSGTHRFVLDYLVEEVILRQSEEVQSFLLATSILERLRAPLCDAVTGRQDSQEMLERLERSNLFTIPLDDRRDAYRYHHLFAELLRARLRQTRPGEEEVFRLRASEWYAAAGMCDEAIAQAVAARDVPRALALLEKFWPRYSMRGEFEGFVRWLNALPPDAVRAHPQLCAIRAWVPILRGELDGIETTIDDIEAALAHPDAPGDPAIRRTVPAQIALARGSVALLAHRDPSRAFELAREAKALIPPDIPDDLAAILNGVTALLIAHAQRYSGALEEAVSSFRDAMPYLWASRNAIGVATATLHSARINHQLGRDAEAMSLCQEAIQRARDEGFGDSSALGEMHIAVAELLLSQGDRSAARVEGERARDMARMMGSRITVLEADTLLERIANADANDGPARPSELLEALTDREREILGLLAAGRSNRQIADELVIALGTVKAHVHAICAKLDVASRLEAVARGRALGLLR